MGADIMTAIESFLQGKVALVTGAGQSGGIGAATCKALAQAGAQVVLTDIAGSPFESTAADFAAEGMSVLPFALDISDETAVKAAIDFTVAQFGRLDILSNNAASQGQREDALIADMPVALWDEIMAVNVRGTMLMCKHSVPAMIKGGGGSIVNISSGTTTAGDFFATAYATSKGAINTFTKYVATQYGAQGIRCNAIVTGLIATSKLLETMPEPMRNVFQDHCLIPRLGRPEDIANMVAFLGSDRSDYITGQLLPVDGGIYSHIPTTVEIRRWLAGMH
jgi:NAD(P)-dependent dehydrogenase (short-subunit alcohol dehydrogenase family)